MQSTQLAKTYRTKIAAFEIDWTENELELKTDWNVNPLLPEFFLS